MRLGPVRYEEQGTATCRDVARSSVDAPRPTDDTSTLADVSTFEPTERAYKEKLNGAVFLFGLVGFGAVVWYIDSRDTGT
jgi:hypothetical protein